MLDFKEGMNSLDLHVLEGGLFFGDRSWHHDRIVSPFNRFYWMMEGEGSVHCSASLDPLRGTPCAESGRRGSSGEEASGYVTLRPGHVYLIPAGLTCDYRCPERFVKFYMHANVRMFGHEDLFQGLEDCLEQPWSIQKTQEMTRLAATGTDASLLKLKGLVLETAAAFLSLAGDRMQPREAARNRYGSLLRAVMENPAQVTLESLAEMQRVPLSTLTRTFRQEMGVTLRQYIRSSLMEQVKIRLQSSDVPIRTIAADAGIEDEFYFSRLFRHHVGVSPSDYRKRNRMT